MDDFSDFDYFYHSLDFFGTTTGVPAPVPEPEPLQNVLLFEDGAPFLMEDGAPISLEI